MIAHDRRWPRPVDGRPSALRRGAGVDVLTDAPENEGIDVMPDILDAQLVAFYLFDVAETIDLTAIPPLVGGRAIPARLVPKPATPAYVQYEKPPLSFDGELVGLPGVEGFKLRFRVYDYGVISLALSRAFTGSWGAFVSEAQHLVENVDLEQRAEAFCETVVARLHPALVAYRTPFMAEDYLVCALHRLERPVSAEVLLAEHGDDIAAMLRGERQPLSAEEKTAILSHRISYLVDDLVVPTWNAAFVYDTTAGTQATLEILEFANSQLLEFRYFDALLDAQLASIYPRLQRPRGGASWVGSRYARAARHVHALFIDVNELTDRTENALKFVGDIYAARLFTLAADRLGLDRWKANTREKLRTLDAIYRFAVEHSSMARGQLLELAVVLILVLELLLVFMGVMK